MLVVELRRVAFSPTGWRLEYRCRNLRIDAWGEIRGLDEWSDWIEVPTVDEVSIPKCAPEI